MRRPPPRWKEPRLPAVFLFSLILVPVQRTVNRINRHIDPALGDAERFRGWEIALAVPGSLLLLLAIAGMFLV